MTVFELLLTLLNEVKSGNGDREILLKIEDRRNTFLADKEITIYQGAFNNIIISAKTED